MTRLFRLNAPVSLCPTRPRRVAAAARAAVGAALALMAAGCNRAYYRQQADCEVGQLIARGSADPRWRLPAFTIQPKPESRMYDPNPPDCPPMPPDDPTSHQLMRRVDGKRGWPYWDEYGHTPYVENPSWRAYLPYDENGQVVLDRRGAVRLALVHSRAYQRELEILYLSALDVTAERFRFDTQFFGGNATFFTVDGPLRGPGGSLSELQTDTDLRLSRYTATGAEILAGFANSLVWQFAGPDTYSSLSVLDFSVLQPLLRAGGRAVVLESLTDSERALLANIRQMERFRHGFYVVIVAGGAAVGPARGALDVTALGESAPSSPGGILDLVQRQVRIRNQEQNVSGLRSSYDQLLAAHEADRIDRYQVDLARQALYNAQSGLLSLEADYDSQLDAYKITLGLPPDLDVKISDPLLDQFDMIDPALTETQQSVAALAGELRRAEGAPPADYLERAARLRRQAAAHLVSVRKEVGAFREALPERRKSLMALYEGEKPTPGEPHPAAEAIQALDDRARQLEMAFTKLAEPVAQPPQPPGSAGEPPLGREAMETTLARIETFLQDPAAALARAAAIAEAEAAQAKTLADLAAAEAAARLKAFTEAKTPEQAAAAEAMAAEAAARSKSAAVVAESLAEAAAAAKARTPPQLLLALIEPLSMQLSDLSLLQARARLEMITLVPIELSPEEALRIARANRLDWMNARAALVDRWRQIEVVANALKSQLDVTLSGDLRTVGDNPVAFRGTNGELRAGLEFDAPLTRLLERNDYRETLIDYQRARRDYYAYEDRVNQTLREILRSIRVDQKNFELRRANVSVSISQVDLAAEKLRAPPRPGETPKFGATVARDLVTALSGLLDAQNSFLGVWVDYEVQRMSLDFDLGTMQLDQQGLWIDPGPIRPGDGSAFPQPEEVPPGIEIPPGAAP